MARMFGLYRETRNSGLQSMDYSDYTSKTEFAQDIRRNGFRVVAVLSIKDCEAIRTRKSGTVQEEMKIYKKYNEISIDWVDQVYSYYYC